MDQIEEIKRKIDIVELINSYVPLKKAGRHFKALCPFHSEAVPSFIVSPERQIFKCFGCGEGGDIFEFLMKIENLEFGEALRELAKRAGVRLTQYKPTEGEREKELLYEINHLAAEFYHWLLLNHPVGKRAMSYILGRGIKRESLERFKLGFAPNLWEGLQRFLVKKKGYRVEDKEKAGLVIRGPRFYDRFRGRLMFPLKNHRGSICGFAGRVLDPQAKEAKYVNTPETLIYHKSELLYGLSETSQEIKKADRVVLVEGELDAISSYQAGVKNVVAIKGSALTTIQAQLLARFTKNITFSLDRDLAGDQACRRAVEVADKERMAIRVVELEGGKDPDEVAQKNPELWRKLVEEAVPVYDYFLDSAFSRFDGKTAEGKKKIGEELVPVLAKMTDKIVQAHYLRALSERLEVAEAAVIAEIEKMATPEEKSALAKTKPTEEKSRREILEEHSLALAFQADKWGILAKRKIVSLIKTPRFSLILEILADYLKKYKTWSSERLGKMLPAELVEAFNQFYLLDLRDLATDEEKFALEFAKTLTRLAEIDLREKLKAISQKIKELERRKSPSAADQKTLRALSQEFRDLTSRLAEFEMV